MWLNGGDEEIITYNMDIMYEALLVASVDIQRFGCYLTIIR